MYLFEILYVSSAPHHILANSFKALDENKSIPVCVLGLAQQ